MFAGWGVPVVGDDWSSTVGGRRESGLSMRRELRQVQPPEHLSPTPSHSQQSSNFGLDEMGAWEKHQTSTSLPHPPQLDATMSVSTLQSAVPINVQRSSISAEGKEAGVRDIPHPATLLKPLTTRLPSSFSHSITLTNMQGSGSLLSL
jgi:hypothetical protein